MRSIVLYDSSAHGHHVDYLLHLVLFWSKNFCDSSDRLTIVSTATFPEICSKYHLSMATNLAPNVAFKVLDEKQLSRIRRLGAIRRSMEEWKLVRSYCNEIKATDLVLMYFDIFVIGLLCKKLRNISVRGIYFRTPDLNSSPSFRERLLTLRKNVIMRFLLMRKVVDHIFCLDDRAAESINQMGFAAAATWLPDPVEKYQIDASQISELRKSLGIPHGRKVLLIFGLLDERKGIETTLEALSLLKDADQERLSLVLAGIVAHSYEDSIQKVLKSHSSKVYVVKSPGGVYGKDIQAYFEMSDLIVALYKNHTGSSSVIVRAAMKGKPLLASDFGYMGDIVRRRNLGRVANSNCASAITTQLDAFLKGDFDQHTNELKEFGEENTPDRFAATIFDNVFRNRLIA